MSSAPPGDDGSGAGRGAAGRAVHVVVVESPAKAKTIGRYLGDGYRVLASYGHAIDLPARDGSVRPGSDFEMVYETAPRARRALGAIRAALAGAESLVLATDPDREGEAISWQVLAWLRERGAIGDAAVRRVVFHEITPEAVREAMARPRELDMDLVHAQQARRALDYLVGFHLSPVLWRKIPGSRSAGRVQSVALRLVCEREAEIESFVPHEYWTVDADLATRSGAPFAARLERLDGAEPGSFGIETHTIAERARERVRSAALHVEAVERDEARRVPPPPFTTASLQQDASRQLGFPVRRTMEVAQALYEGVELAGDAAGLITYMRTDSAALSRGAAEQAMRIVERRYGEAYLPAAPPAPRAPAPAAREAHEAIRPTDFSREPEWVADRLGPDEGQLYALIWRRAVASRMAPARIGRVRVDIGSAQADLVLRASAAEPVFDGFLRLYREGRDDDPGHEAAGRRLPAMTAGETVTAGEVRTTRRFTRPPPRYTEAGLVHRLEELGIGRPSTYASIVGVLREREYVALNERRFVPLERGRVVTAFLESYFARWLAYGFTAGLERDLDRIAAGALAWKGFLRAFWGEFDRALAHAGTLRRDDVREALDAALEGLAFGRGAPAGERPCPRCRDGQLEIRLGRRGAFVGCSNFPRCRFSRPLAPGLGGAGQERPLGDDPDTGLPVALRRSRYGPYVERGEPGGEHPTARVSVPQGLAEHEVTLAVARALLALPREVGVHPSSGQTILAGMGRYGPWLKHGQTYVSIPPDDDVLTVGLNRAVVLLEGKLGRKGD